ncbi:class I SAM-dependent methyltransferase [Lysobacter gummosus]|uniref:Class I SAM-dependent methyltransferase n=1 Tax=Lysobacter gummosus TaxID=262324 RepID=A0ABY3XBW8_9GAMM|nr:class I SAM-dependent methyltransferase [Lysobacter gummosus]UNP28627.1 class I SAM-dependent methyltransferase [Lysobacter gummosus]
MSEIEALHGRVIHQLRNKEVHDPDFQALAWIDHHVRPIRTVLDVGANGGQTIASVRAVLGEAVEIHSFEANPKLWPGLERIAQESGGAVHVHRSALGTQAGELILHVPSSGGQVFLEESTFDPSQFDKPWVREKYLARGGQAPELLQMRVPVERGDDCALRPDLIKVDVEGFEASAIRGLLRTIVEFQPVLLVENSDWHNVTELLSELGYRPFRWDDGAMNPFHGATTNTFYLPAEKPAVIATDNQMPDLQPQPEAASAGYSEAADVAEHLADVERMRQLLASLGVSLPGDGLALDVGGGAGGHSALLANDVRRIYCTDYFDQNARFGGELVKLVKEKVLRHGHDFPVERFEFHAVDAMSTIYRDDLFDVVFSFNAFEHIPDPAAALREIVRVLKPGGMAYITFDPIWTCDFGSHFQHRVPRPWQHLISDDGQFVEMMKQAGGSDEEGQEYVNAMNRRRLSFYRELFASFRDEVEYLHEGEWSGCVVPGSESHENFQRCLSLGYSREELLLRGMVKVFRKKAPGQAPPAAEA